MLYSDNLYTMVGRVRDARPGAGGEQYRKWVNDAIREVINLRTYWTGLRKIVIVPIPNQTNTGTITVTQNQKQVVGVGTDWPVNDVVSTTLATPVVNPSGYEEVSLASMTGITADSILLIDAGTPSQEVVPVMRFSINERTITGNFQFPHNIGATVTQSSLVQQQLRLGYNWPIFTVTGVQSPTVLYIDNAWGGPTQNSVTYYILKMYFSLDPNLRQIMAVVDQQQGNPLRFNVTQQELNVWDPQRTDNSDPVCLASLAPNLCGNMFYEIWPAPTCARQIGTLLSLQWPELVNNEDFPPPFLDPTLFTDLASSRALRHRLSKDDWGFDPKLAPVFEKMYRDKITPAIEADEAICIQDYKTQLASLLPMVGGDYWLSHCPEQIAFLF